MILRTALYLLCCTTALWALAQAQEGPSVQPRSGPTERQQLERVLVTGPRLIPEPTGLALDTPSGTASRLGLTPRELPVSVDIIGREAIEERGHRTTLEAIESGVGITASNPPGDPATFSLRGFTDNQITQLSDGVRVGPTTMTARQLDTWNFERIELLKGPASVLYGEGAIGGAINYVTRRPKRDDPLHVDGLLSYGSFHTLRLGVGSGGPLYADKLFYRVDFSRQTSSGFIDETSSEYRSLTSALLFEPSKKLSLQLSFDMQHDDLSPYWGTPLVPQSFARQPLSGVIESNDGRTIDRRMSRVNYNVTDNVLYADSYWGRLKANWQATPALQVRNELYYYHADRRWENAETYAFDPTTRLVNRDRFFVGHDQDIIGNRSEALLRLPLFGLPNRFLVGLDTNHLDFDRPAFFQGDVDNVDPFRPVRGRFALPLVSAKQETTINTTALFFEDQLTIVKPLKLVAGVRTEWIDLDRKVFDTAGALRAAPSFTRTFRPTTWRVGLVYDVLPTLSLYGQYSTAADPAGLANIFLVRSEENVNLSRGKQWELGLKQRFWENRVEWTLAYFHIVRTNLLTQVSLTDVASIGQQSSHGLEVAAVVRPLPQWKLQGNVTILDAQFDEFAEATRTGVLSHNGNLPPNVPRLVANLWTSYRLPEPRLPLEFGGSLRYISGRFNDNANTVKMLAYHTVDAFVGWRFPDGYGFKNSQVNLRVRNLFDKDYAIWGDVFYPSQVLLGEPRSIEVALSGRFAGF